MSLDVHTSESPRHLTADELALGMADVCGAPQDRGTVELIVGRPREGERMVQQRARLSPEGGLAGDRWQAESWRKNPDGTPDPAVQITLMNARCIGLVAPDRKFWPLAGDNLFVDLDLSRHNLPVGTRLTLGGAILEITQPPHNGCWKFEARFGKAAVQFVNSMQGKSLRLRGVHARVVQGGSVAVGDTIRVERPT